MEQEQYRKMRRAFSNQRSLAKRRGISFEFTWDQWRAWWLDQDRWSHRGCGRGQLCMARRGDVGPYAPWNVWAATHAQNMLDVPPQIRHARAVARWARLKSAGIRSHLFGKTGAAHPKSRRVLTPGGEFPSAQAAATAAGITRAAASLRANRGTFGWRYAQA